MPRLDRHSSTAIAALSAALAVTAVLLLLGPLRGLAPATTGFAVPWWLLVPAFTAAELLVVHVQARRESLSVSFAEVPLVLGLAASAPVALVASSVLGSAIGLLLRRQAGLKLAFNLALFASEAALAAAVYRLALAGADPASLRGIAAATATIVLTDLASAAALTAVIWLKVGAYDEGVLREAVGAGLVMALTNTSVGLLVVVLLQAQPAALILLLAVVATVVLAYRGYAAQSQGHARLESLYRFTRQVGRSDHTDAVAESVLRQARDVLSAEVAELALLPTPDAPGLRVRLDGEQVLTLPSAPAGWWEPVMHGQALRVPRGEDPAATIRDGLAAPVVIEGTIVGVLTVTDRPHHLASFSDADLRLFESLAGHASLSLQKARLLDQLRREAAAQQHRSLHDPTTGLPNRRFLLQALEAELAASGRVAVLVLDLDGFTQINDALGHGTGNSLLQQAALRLQPHGTGPGHVARLGNDEFAVLLPAPTDVVDAERRARTVLAGLTAPIDIGGLGIDLRASGGLATAPEHGVDAEMLLQRADGAMYEAKRQGSGLRLWNPASAGDSARRLALLADLRDAIAGRELDVYYQPKVDLVTGAACGAEALARWNHPRHGWVRTDEFIPLAEHSDLVQPLTAVVLDAALAQCARWRAGGWALGVAVNLSARSLSDLTLPDEVAGALDRAGLPPAALTLEITETAVMSDLTRALEVLHGLRELGVRLSVDDFGTGQSSLTYLKRLPIHEMKIDRSFVAGIAADPGDAAIVRASIDLGHALGLQVVAEGIEDAETRRLLGSWSCDIIQGYFVGRPMSAASFDAWLALTLPVVRAGDQQV